MIFSNPSITIAGKIDLMQIESLLNRAYRGEESLNGWTSEANLIDGNIRTTLNDLAELYKRPGTVFLKYVTAEGVLQGCVNLQQHDGRLYLGMLSVLPQAQGSGTGKQLLKAAEEYAKAVNCNIIYMSVIDVRHELIAWYTRHGYADTGERKKFEEDGVTGKHQQPLQFMIMEKDIR